MNEENYVINRVDGLIANHQYLHDQTVPKKIKMNVENANELMESIKRINNFPAQTVITHFRESEIVVDSNLNHDDFVIE